MALPRLLRARSTGPFAAVLLHNLALPPSASFRAQLRYGTCAHEFGLGRWPIWQLKATDVVTNWCPRVLYFCILKLSSSWATPPGAPSRRGTASQPPTRRLLTPYPYPSSSSLPSWFDGLQAARGACVPFRLPVPPRFPAPGADASSKSGTAGGGGRRRPAAAHRQPRPALERPGCHAGRHRQPVGGAGGRGGPAATAAVRAQATGGAAAAAARAGAAVGVRHLQLGGGRRRRGACGRVSGRSRSSSCGCSSRSGYGSGCSCSSGRARWCRLGGGAGEGVGRGGRRGAWRRGRVAGGLAGSGGGVCRGSGAAGRGGGWRPVAKVRDG